MTPEQLVYLKLILHPSSNALLNEFAKRVNLQGKINAFEAEVQAAWNKFIHEHQIGTPLPKAPDQYNKLVLEDFGATQPEQQLSLQKQRLPDTLLQAAPVRPSHSSQVLASALGGPAPSKPSPQPPASIAPASTSATLPTTDRPPDAAAPTNSATAPLPATSTAAAPAIRKPIVTPEPPKAPFPGPAIRFSIRNARQNDPYEGEIQCDPKVAGLRLLDVKLPEGVGLTVDNQNWRITGTPALAGEFNLGLRYDFGDQSSYAPQTGGMPFVINADPKTLWQNLPSDRSAPFWKEDIASSVVLGQNAKMIAARKRGRSHAHKGTCCDDDFQLHYDAPNGWYLAVVADGAGSAKFSRRGSQIATRAVSSYLQEVFSDDRGTTLAEAIEAYAQSNSAEITDGELELSYQKTRNELFKTIGYAAHHAVLQLQEEAKNRSDIIAAVKELSTTLLIGLARKVGEKWFCAAYWVGDGAVAVYRRNKSVHLLGTPDSGEFSGQTHFLDASQVSQEALLRRLRFELVDDMTAFLLMTDGVSDPKFRSEAAMGEAADWDQLWVDLDAGARLSSDEEGHETRLLEWLDFWAQGEYDDRTIAIIY